MCCFDTFIFASMIAAIALANIFIKSHISHFLFVLTTVKI